MAAANSRAANRPVVLLIPDIDGASADHWQSRWRHRGHDVRTLDMGDLSRPDRSRWVDRLDAAIRAIDRPVLLVAHGLGCHAVAWWSAVARPPFGSKIAGALLVAPPNLDAGNVDPRMAGFGPTPKGMLPFRLAVVASHNDPFGSYYHARLLAIFWGGECLGAGNAGHIDDRSDLGNWDAGWDMLARLAAPLDLGDPACRLAFPADPDEVDYRATVEYGIVA